MSAIYQVDKTERLAEGERVRSGETIRIVIHCSFTAEGDV